MPQRPGKRIETVAPRASVPAWFQPLFLVLSCVLLVALFSREISDTDFFWHLKSGQYIFDTRSLPDPDPFAYTTATAHATYSGEEITRRFNLTHEWLSQVLIYLVFRLGGFAGVVLGRAGLLASFCIVAGLIAYRRNVGFYRSVAVTFAVAALAYSFAADRPYLVSFVLLAITVAILDSGRRALLWVLPLVMLVWANCHGGFVLGWVILGGWSAEALWFRLRGRTVVGDSRLWLVSAASILITGLNPNGFRVISVLLDYRRSFLTSTLSEWRPIPLWPPSVFVILLVAGAAVLLYARRRVRMIDGMLFLVFAAAGLWAGRNTFLIGLWSPILIATYLPKAVKIGAWVELGAAVLLSAALISVAAAGRSLQLRVAEWAFPTGAAEFFRSHGLTQRMFNTYEYGGYLIWKLWPQERVFIDGRALSESLFADYGRILYFAGDSNGKSAAQLLEQYGIEVIVMNTFEHSSGVAHTLAPALAEAENQQWKLVYADATAVVFMRHPAAGMQVLDSARVFDAMQAECDLHIEHEPQYPGCARALGLMFASVGEPANARRWLEKYLEHVRGKDPEAEAEFQKLLAQ